MMVRFSGRAGCRFFRSTKFCIVKLLIQAMVLVMNHISWLRALFVMFVRLSPQMGVQILSGGSAKSALILTARAPSLPRLVLKNN